jgi:methionine-rich copper-binding protein CopC
MKKAILFVVMLSLVAFVSVSIAADAPKAATTPAPAKAVSTAPAKAASTAPAPAMKEMKFGGAIKSVDAMAKSFVVAGKDKKEMTFAANDTTKIVKGKKDLTFADLKAGQKVHVEYKMEMDKAIAVMVKVAGK